MDQLLQTNMLHLRDTMDMRVTLSATFLPKAPNYAPPRPPP